MSTPERMCVVCRQMKEKRYLLRIVKTKDGEICYDPTGKMQGRGAYICPTRECFDRLPKTKGFERSFKCQVPCEVFEAVNEKIGE
ncbi:MAG: RNase P modulator RnpM [Clostridia bacterium]